MAEKKTGLEQYEYYGAKTHLCVSAKLGKSMDESAFELSQSGKPRCHYGL